MRWSGSITKAEGLAVSVGQTHESRGAWFNISMCSWEVIYAYFSFIGPCNPFTVSETCVLVSVTPLIYSACGSSQVPLFLPPGLCAGLSFA